MDAANRDSAEARPEPLTSGKRRSLPSEFKARGGHPERTKKPPPRGTRRRQSFPLRKLFVGRFGVALKLFGKDAENRRCRWPTLEQPDNVG